MHFPSRERSRENNRELEESNLACLFPDMRQCGCRNMSHTSGLYVVLITCN